MKILSKEIITSWDDGHPLDLKVAELLHRYRVPGIFYIPVTNIEGRPTLNKNEIRELSKEFEIGAHSYSHVDLTKISLQAAEEEIRKGKEMLEEITGKKITKFCYPRGHYKLALKKIVKKLGFKSARIVRLYNTRAPGKDFFEHEPNFHLYKHSFLVYFGHLLKYRDLESIKSLIKTYSNDLEKMLENTIEITEGRDFHMWGHSWELEERNIFPVLGRILKQYANS